MPLDLRNLLLRFEEIKDGYARAKTIEEKRELLARLSEVLRQAEEQVDALLIQREARPIPNGN